MKFSLTTFRFSCLVFCIICASCSEKSNEPPQGVLTEAQQKALNAAKQTEQVLQDANQAQHKKIDEASGG